MLHPAEVDSLGIVRNADQIRKRLGLAARNFLLYLASAFLLESEQGTYALACHVHSFGPETGTACSQNGHPFRSYPIRPPRRCSRHDWRGQVAACHRIEADKAESQVRVPFFHRCDGWDGMAILDPRDIRTNQSSSFFNFSLRKFFLLSERT